MITADDRQMTRLIQTFVLCAAVTAAAPFAARAQSNPLAVVPADRVPVRIDNSSLIALPGNIHPLASPENDAGPVPPDYAMSHLVLVLKRDASQQAALENLSAAQQDLQSPLYHRWIEPGEFGAHFGVSPNDVNRVSSWLRSQGFTIEEIPVEQWMIKFNGTAAQVETAFHTPIHFYRTVDGLHFANSANPQIPQALAPVVAGVAALHDFQPRPQIRLQPSFVVNGTHSLAPADFATIYDVSPLYASGITGAGYSIAIIAPCSMPDLSLVGTFWSDYVSNRTGGIYTNYYWHSPNTSVPACDNNKSGEAYLDLEVSGAVAPGADIRLVASDEGVYDAAYNAVHNKLAPIVSISYSSCEPGLGTVGNSEWQSLWSLAASMGITGMASSGDAGVDGCDNQTAATAGVLSVPAVNGICSTPYSLCVGGTQFDDTANPTAYWGTTGNALQYIPELAWNESAANGGSELWSSGGGYSTVYAKTLTPWQTGNSNGMRGVPDVSLSAAGHDPYVTCPSTPCGPSAGVIWFSSGTSASSPAFAGIVALLLQSTGQYQGNLAPALYQLAANPSFQAFHDVTSGNNSVPGMQGYQAGPGWDPVTGLGSVDANVLITHWPNASTTVPSVTLSPTQLTFASQPLGSSSASQPVTLANTGTATLNITSIAIGGTNSADFTQTNNCGSAVAAGASCAIAVVFRPTAAGTRSASLSISDNAAGSPHGISLTGSGGGSTLPPVSQQRVTTVAPPPVGCVVPPSSSSFLTSQSTVYLYFQATVTFSDQLSLSWLAPNGDVVPGLSWQIGSGNFCFSASLDISNPKSGHLGAWQAAVYDNGTLLFEVPFTVSALNQSTPLQLVTVAPCRVMDTRNNTGMFGGPYLIGKISRTVPIPSSTCRVPATAMAYSLNITVVPKTKALSSLLVWPTGQSQPLVSTITSPDGSVIADAALVPAGTGGSIDAYSTDDTDLVIDINGYFVPPAGGTLQFYPLAPCRVLDTRNPNDVFGGPGLTGGAAGRSFPIPSSPCGAPSNAAAYSLNVTVVPEGPLGFLTAWPTGQLQPFVSTMNSYDGTVIANAAIVPAGSGGSASFYASNNTNFVVDINGYFAPPGPGGLNFYTVTPCRIVDTRKSAGTFGGPALGANATRSFPLSQGPQGPCGLPGYPSAQAYSLSMTALPQGVLGFLSAWPTGGAQPVVSTLNAWKGQGVANAAIVPSGTSGSIDVYVTNATDLLIDTAGYFGP